MNLLRALFPKWSFFDRVVNSYFLEFSTDHSLTWERIDFSQKRTWGSLFINTDLNLALLEVSLIEQFAQDLQDESKSLSELETYSMIKNLVQSKSQIKINRFRLLSDNEALFDSGTIND